MASIRLLAATVQLESLSVRASHIAVPQDTSDVTRDSERVRWSPIDCVHVRYVGETCSCLEEESSPQRLFVRAAGAPACTRLGVVEQYLTDHISTRGPEMLVGLRYRRLVRFHKRSFVPDVCDVLV
jgi:hypothetical protein